MGSVLMVVIGAIYSLYMKKTPLSLLPVLAGFLGHSYWLLGMVGTLTVDNWGLPLYTAPLVLGLHIANQLADVSERRLGVRGIAHCLGRRNAFLVSLCAFSVSPVLILVATYRYTHRSPSLMLWLGMSVFYLTMRSWISLVAKDSPPEGDRFGLKFLPVAVGALVLVVCWIASLSFIPLHSLARIDQ